MHFMKPVPMKPMVEVIRGYHTFDATIETAKALLANLGKECIIVNGSPGFVSNRVLMLTINEAIFLLQDQVASVEDVDGIFKTCFGNKMGPLETADIGDPRSIIETSIAKYFASAVVTKMASDAVQVHGANGCSSEGSVTN
jgi:3-hydroxyacyl-CoA dehydrogenase